MKKLLLATVALAALALPAQAALIKDLGINPTSAQGQFSNSVGGTTFSDEYTFTLSGSPQFITFSSATNVYTDPEDFITNFSGQLFRVTLNSGPVAVSPEVDAVACPTNPTGCQVLAGSAILDAGAYFLRLTGTGGGESGYGGNLTTAGVGVVPIPGMALAVPLGALGLAWVARRRRKA
jgi:uncharacterized protein (TIGR03382 family)